MKTHLELAQLFKTIDCWSTIGTDTQYRVLEYSDEVVIIFCPSNSKADWKINFSFPKKPYKRMKTPFYVHGGFLKEWKKINDHFLKEAAAYNKPITVCGWSYGGAMATLCYEDIWFKYPQKRYIIRLVTFGSPRVIGAYNFKKIWVRWHGANLYVNGSDIVTEVPPVLFGFRHVAKTKHIGGKKFLIGYFKPKKYHHIDGYIESLGDVTCKTAS
ncbi:lipase family protein [Sphaerochaeta globosa]|uniref:Lipase class 3 n=1 Tax=Sphaerochaeta globosa (strain ATCC BAA-1886 / DSM 22777 / Buddy) TaxID=158189 RepID=F0RWR7_SPHGB|nr:lipase family protein [Sphaerochaeta globosa]ADY13698.1 lipase class 3 [Sphaerochaeta globosa str. Buddy]